MKKSSNKRQQLEEQREGLALLKVAWQRLEQAWQIEWREEMERGESSEANLQVGKILGENLDEKSNQLLDREEQEEEVDVEGLESRELELESPPFMRWKEAPEGEQEDGDSDQSMLTIGLEEIEKKEEEGQTDPDKRDIIRVDGTQDSTQEKIGGAEPTIQEQAVEREPFVQEPEVSENADNAESEGQPSLQLPQLSHRKRKAMERERKQQQRKYQLRKRARVTKVSDLSSQYREKNLLERSKLKVLKVLFMRKKADVTDEAPPRREVRKRAKQEQMTEAEEQSESEEEQRKKRKSTTGPRLPNNMVRPEKIVARKRNDKGKFVRKAREGKQLKIYNEWRKQQKRTSYHDMQQKKKKEKEEKAARRKK